MKKILKIGLFGAIIWAVPFVTSFFFYSKDKQLLIDMTLFKSIMLIIGMITAITLLVLYLSKVERNYIFEAVMVTSVWLVINIILDSLILIPLAGLSVQAYIYEIGLKYFIGPIIGAGFGILLEKKARFR
jgi:hypothetical protein